MYVLELPQKPDDPDAAEHWHAELKKFRTFLQDRFATTITDCQLRQAIAVMNRERALRRELAALMQADVPPLTRPATALAQEQHLRHSRGPRPV